MTRWIAAFPEARLSGRSPVRVLHPGDVACGERGDRFETLLGSCVSVMLTDPRRTVGAMCHIVHASPDGADTTHADAALRTLYGLLRARAIQPPLCEAYVAGGGNMFPSLYERAHVGDSNTRHVLDALARDGVRVVAQDTGGTRYRRVTWTVGPERPCVVAVDIPH